ncbi:patatin-like phospholipase family protein [Catenovulum sp. SM1970]|nr:patatin-like phospholipase family protein [Marinifaba aquimaris]
MNLDEGDIQSVKIVPILSGGGTRLTTHIGILAALKELKIGFEHIVGVSGGSIVSSLYCSGMSLEEIKELAINTDFRKLRTYSIYRLLKDGGLCSGDKFEAWLDSHLKGVTFKDLKHSLHIVATDVSGGGPVVFNKKNTPDLKVSTAVRFSMSIPLIFSFKPYEDHLLVDGAILAEDTLFKDWAGDGTPAVCFRLKSEQKPNKELRSSWFPLKHYIFMLIRTFMNALSREYVHANHWHNTIVIDTGTASSVDFDISAEEKEELYRAGYLTVLSYLPKKLIQPIFG